MACTEHTIRNPGCGACYPRGRESASDAYARRQDEAAAREIRDLRTDTLKGLNYVLDVLGVAVPGSTDAETLRSAIAVVGRRWPA